MNAFITGSRVYGKQPTSDTDIDLVVHCDQKTADLLRSLSDIGKKPVRYGKLNLILLTTEEEFAAWLVANAGLVAEYKEGWTDAHDRPIHKDHATYMIDQVFGLAGLPPRSGVSQG